MATTYRNISPLCDDILEMVGRETEKKRMVIWRGQHAQVMRNCFQEISDKWAEWKATEEGEDWLENLENHPYNPENILEHAFNFLSDVPTNEYGHKQRKSNDFWMDEYTKQYLICWDDPSGDKGLWDNERDGFCPRFGVW